MTISIIICTYNPDVEIFERLITAVENLKKPVSSGFEIIIVDNNSKEPIANNNRVVKLLSTNANAKLIVEKNPGLTSARLAGATASTGEWLVFFDDDNEPEENYLINLEKLILENKQVGCWGPGIINVEYIGNEINPWFYKNKGLFQEKKMTETQIGLEPRWLDCYPFGTGLCIKQEIVNAYKKNIDAGNFTLTDRIGKKLISGGDTQLVFQAIKLGQFAGTSNSLIINHLIAKKKIRFSYLLRQVYMTTTCFVKAYNEIGFENKTIAIEFSGNIQIIKSVYYVYKINIKNKPFRNVLLLIYERLGEVNARYFAAHNLKRPVVLKIFELLINV